MKNIIIALILVLGFAGLYKLLSTNPSQSGVSDDVAELIVYWGDGCPHCETVKDYIKANKSDEKTKISLKEVYYSKTNQKSLEESVKLCPEIDSSQGVGVPLAVVKATNQCLYGSEPIINWLSSR